MQLTYSRFDPALPDTKNNQSGTFFKKKLTSAGLPPGRVCLFG
jgi:hypothetical protein